jgi:hypothetical protein
MNPSEATTHRHHQYGENRMIPCGDQADFYENDSAYVINAAFVCDHGILNEKNQIREK